MSGDDFHPSVRANIGAVRAQPVNQVQEYRAPKGLLQASSPFGLAPYVIGMSTSTGEMVYNAGDSVRTLATIATNAARQYQIEAQLRMLVPAHENLQPNEPAILMGRTVLGDISPELWRWDPSSLSMEQPTVRNEAGQVTTPGVIVPTFQDTNLPTQPATAGRWLFVRNWGGAGDAIDTTGFATDDDVNNLDTRLTTLENNAGQAPAAPPGSNLFIDFAQAEPASPANGDVWIADGWAAVNPGVEPFQGQRAERVNGAWVFNDIPDGTIYHRIRDGAAFRIEA